MIRTYKIAAGCIIACFLDASYAEVIDPCNKNILAVFRRPTVITSACTTPLGKYTFEAGVDYLDFTNKTSGLVFPQSKVRIGLPWRNEFAVILPSENTNTKKASGLSWSQFTFKHNIFYTEHWNTAVRAIYAPASGSKIYGTSRDGGAINGILAYRFNSFNASAMLSYSVIGTSDKNGGKRFNTISPDVAVGWQAIHWLQLYAEIYGQLNTAPNKGPGYNMDTGLLFLITKNIEADVEIGHRLSGQLGNVNVYYGAGFSFLF